GRLPTWSAGGLDGRRLLDPFLEGLGEHLVTGGRAFITHNALVGVARSRPILPPTRFSLPVVLTTLVHPPDEKLARMTQRVLAAEEGRTIHRYGPYAFAEVHIVEIGPAGTTD